MEPIPTTAKKSVVFFTHSHSIVLTIFSHGRNQEQGAPKFVRKQMTEMTVVLYSDLNNIKIFLCDV
jgi:hypothetical protein